jgi:hypothetical protein
MEDHTTPYTFGVKYPQVFESTDTFICSFTVPSRAYSVIHVISMCSVE